MMFDEQESGARLSPLPRAVIRVPMALLVALLTVVVVSGCSQAGGGAAGSFHSSTPKVLTVATALVPTPGLWEGSATRPAGGFEFCIAEALAARFGLPRIRVVVVPFQRLVGGDLGGADLALSLITPTRQRDRVLDFSAPYLTVPPTVLARSGVDVPDLKSARALRWVTVRGTTLEQILDRRIQPTIPLVRVLSRPEVISALQGGRADAALFDFPLALAYASRSAGRLHVPAKLDQPEQIAAALPQGSRNAQAVDSAIRALIADGTIERLSQRWLGPGAKDSGTNLPILRSTRGE